MKLSPYGYKIVNGTVVINKEEAEKLREYFCGYIRGFSMKDAARYAGITDMPGSTRKNMLSNRKYTGNDRYPQIIDEETFDAAQRERLRRYTAHGRNNIPKKKHAAYLARTRFTMDRIQEKYKDPIEQAEYAYEKIKEME